MILTFLIKQNAKPETTEIRKKYSLTIAKHAF